MQPVREAICSLWPASPLTRVCGCSGRRRERLTELSGDVDEPTAVTDATKMLDSYHSLFCRRCYTYDCRHHAFRPSPSATRDLVPVTRARPCGSDCFVHASSTSSTSSTHEHEAFSLTESPLADKDCVGHLPAVCSHGHTMQQQRGPKETWVARGLALSCTACRAALLGPFLACPEDCPDYLCIACSATEPHALLLGGRRAMVLGSVDAVEPQGPSMISCVNTPEEGHFVSIHNPVTRNYCLLLVHIIKQHIFPRQVHAVENANVMATPQK